MVGAHLTSRIKSFVSSIARRRTTRDQVEAFSSVCAGDKAIESSTNDVGPNRKCCSSRSCAYLVSEHDAHESHFDSWHESHNKHLHERLAQTSSHRTAHVPLEPECFSRTAPVRPTKAECVHDGIVDDDCKQSSSPFSRSGSSEELGAKFDTLMNTAALQSCAGALIPAAHAEWSRTASKASAGESSFGDGRWSSSYDSDDEFAVLDPHVPSQRTVTIHNLPEPEAFMSSKRLRVVLQSFNRPTSEEPIIEEHASDEKAVRPFTCALIPEVPSELHYAPRASVWDEDLSSEEDAWSSSCDSDDEGATRTVTTRHLPEPETFLSSKKLRAFVQSMSRSGCSRELVGNPMVQ